MGITDAAQGGGPVRRESLVCGYTRVPVSVPKVAEGLPALALSSGDQFDFLGLKEDTASTPLTYIVSCAVEPVSTPRSSLWKLVDGPAASNPHAAHELGESLTSLSDNVSML